MPQAVCVGRDQSPNPVSVKPAPLVARTLIQPAQFHVGFGTSALEGAQSTGAHATVGAAGRRDHAPAERLLFVLPEVYSRCGRQPWSRFAKPMGWRSFAFSHADSSALLRMS